LSFFLVPEDAAKMPSSPTGNPGFSAVLLAGGKSTRMGRDKAALVFEGQPLWRRQLATLAALQPLELFISGRPDGPFAGNGDLRIIEDLHPGCGPMSGLESVCRRMHTSCLCVLAVDLPWMTTTFLERLVQMALQDGRGVVLQNGEYFEPLAAVYPRSVEALVGDHLARHDYSMQSLIRCAVERDLIVPYALDEEERSLFRNLNTPEDLPARES
jgi:molybdopterin-guanine dinucleotide biosynthesis protein A